MKEKCKKHGVDEVWSCFNNDEAGQALAQVLKRHLPFAKQIHERLYDGQKDWNNIVACH